MHRAVVAIGIFAASATVGFRIQGGSFDANVGAVETFVPEPVAITDTTFSRVSEDGSTSADAASDSSDSSESSKASRASQSAGSSTASSDEASSDKTFSRMASGNGAAASIRSAFSSRSSSVSSLSWEQFTAAMHRGGGRGQAGIAASNGDNADRASPTLVLSDIAKTFGDAAFAPAATSNSAGAITYSSGNTAVATVAGGMITIVGAGTTTVTANQAAAGIFSARSVTATLTVAKGASTISLASSDGEIHYGDSVTLTATVTGNATGTVSFYTGATLLGTSSISGGSATLVTNTLAKGTGSLIAVYGGDANYTGSTSSAITQIVYRNYCTELSPCQNGGSCTPVRNTFSCSCVSPWAGTTCTDSNNNCLDVNTGLYCSGPGQGTCVPDPSGGVCQCVACYTGDYCQLDDLACA